MNRNSLNIRDLAQADIRIIAEAFRAIGWNKTEAQYQKYLEERNRNIRDTLVAFHDGEFAGYVTIKWNPDYPPFHSGKIPEISDLNVLPKFRKRGIASQLIAEAEKRIASKAYSTCGIGVGMTADYGAAQRLYVKLGYIPDGRGLSHRGTQVHYGDETIVDDDLVLWFTKTWNGQ